MRPHHRRPSSARRSDRPFIAHRTGTSRELLNKVRVLDGKGYKAYAELRGTWAFDFFTFHIDHVQGDPFAAPSRVRITVPLAETGLSRNLTSRGPRRRATGDFIARAFAEAIRAHTVGNRGTGRSGRFEIAPLGQEILERSSVNLSRDTLEIRFTVGLPASGRSILAREAAAMFETELPTLVNATCFLRSLDQPELVRHADAAEDQQAMRDQLGERGLAAFVGDGSLLPRRSGVDDRPMDDGNAVRIESPPELRVTLETPNAGTVIGLGIPRGVTLIVGGGYHGKSTLLHALERGVYDHIPGDGRERIVSDPALVKIRSEDGRRVANCNISAFVDNLPLGRSTTDFTSDDASGSTSQAANLLEALEIGARVLVMDEDSSATNFMIRDARMQALVSKDREPITPFVDRVRELWEEQGVSTILVAGGSGDYFEAADQVLWMDNYRPRVVTAEAHAIARHNPDPRRPERAQPMTRPLPRCPVAAGFDPRRGKRDAKVDVKGLQTILFGKHPIDLSRVEQLVDKGQSQAIAVAILRLLEREIDGRTTLAAMLDRLDAEMDEHGLDVLSPHPRGDLARPRRFEIAAAINRLRTVRMECGS